MMMISSYGNDDPDADDDEDVDENDDALAFKVRHWQVCEISELTVDVVHAKPVKRRDDEGGGDDVVGDGVACDSDGDGVVSRPTRCSFYCYWYLVFCVNQINREIWRGACDGGDACDSGCHGGDDGDEGDGDIDDTASEKDNENFGCARVIGQLAVSSESRM